MIRCNSLILTLIFVIFSVGCGKDEATAVNSNGNSASVGSQNTAFNQNAPNNSSNANAGFPAVNSEMPASPSIPANVAVKNNSSSDVKPQLPGQSAPDNSEVTTALGENLVQTRAFKNHPQLNKIESVTTFADGKEKKSVKVYLKSGQVRELPESKIKDAMTEPAANILKAIG